MDIMLPMKTTQRGYLATGSDHVRLVDRAARTCFFHVKYSATKRAPGAGFDMSVFLQNMLLPGDTGELFQTKDGLGAIGH